MQKPIGITYQYDLFASNLSDENANNNHESTDLFDEVKVDVRMGLEAPSSSPSDGGPELMQGPPP